MDYDIKHFISKYNQIYNKTLKRFKNAALMNSEHNTKVANTTLTLTKFYNDKIAKYNKLFEDTNTLEIQVRPEVSDRLTQFLETKANQHNAIRINDAKTAIQIAFDDSAELISVLDEIIKIIQDSTDQGLLETLKTVKSLEEKNQTVLNQLLERT